MIAALTPVIAIVAPAQAATIDWNGLAPLPYRAPPIVTAEMHQFVQRETIARKCPLPEGATGVSVDVAVLVDENGGIRVTVPRSVQCPTAEQYAAALVAGFARNNLLPRMGAGEQWYRTTITFAWAK
ncbi:hypothetical protein [Sphingomonas hengshuiensis]|uniref:TonB C-terminal domain-containing protein n=1 Tax=Sphingomonas hengshuiensis TaxID=1609977 RepID=A0A7U4LFT2_9SPHN|nr:hypothetical protein [Sphingomonas hengshuiensis]AJP72583.1 hypothetical protein TS85_13590 [Sphingomonas hengshuiensis]